MASNRIARAGFAAAAALTLWTAACGGAHAVGERGLFSGFFDLFQIPGIPRELVSWPGREGRGTIVISTSQRRLYYVMGDGTAIRYGVGVGRLGHTWTGVKQVTLKREWPGWTPPPAMRARRPDLPHHIPGGPDNPLGARALYLGSTLYRIHGSNEDSTVGEASSSGCFRMVNADVVDLYNRVGVGTKVVVGP